MKRAAALLFCLSIASAVTPADAKLSKEGTSEAYFVAKATGGMTIRGVTSDVRIDEQQGTIVVVVPLATLKTGIGLRDRHMREKFLETDKHPNAELRVPRSAVAFPDPGASVSKTLSGSLSLHGVTRATELNYAARRDGSTYRVNGALRVGLKDFGIKTPSFMGVTVSDAIDVRVQFQAIDNP